MIDIKVCTGAQVAPYLDDVAALRIAVFSDWPYLYAGDREYEKKYLGTYAESPQSLFVLALDGDRVVDASTGIPLVDETAAFQEPFQERGIALADVFYFGESVLLAEYRGRGIGHRFFDEREGYARRLGGFAMTAFCAIERDQADPRRPQDHRGNETFWNKRGYRCQDDMVCRLEWQEIGHDMASCHRLHFWLRPLDPA